MSMSLSSITLSPKRLVASLMVASALLGVAATSVAAAPASPTATPATTTAGAPATNDASPVGYYLWHDDGVYHLRTHGPGAEHRFVARLKTNGTFQDVDKAMLEKDDRVTVKDDGHMMVLRFQTYGAWDGVDFRVDGGEHVNLNLKLDGQEISTANIFLGSGGAHPATDPFTIEI